MQDLDHNTDKKHATNVFVYPLFTLQ